YLDGRQNGPFGQMRFWRMSIVDQSSPNLFASASASSFDSACATTFRHPGLISWPTAPGFSGYAVVAQTTWQSRRITSAPKHSQDVIPARRQPQGFVMQPLSSYKGRQHRMQINSRWHMGHRGCGEVWPAYSLDFHGHHAFFIAIMAASISCSER